MADKNQFQAFLRARVIGAIHSARAASNLTHQGVKGTVLEILIRDLFRPLLPSDIGVGTGQILECATGRLSPQVDVILYDKSILPPILFDESNGIFPVEAVLYAIEVKTTLTRREIETSHENARTLHSFSYIPGDTESGASSPQLEKLRNVIFALKSDLIGNYKTEPMRYREIYQESDIYVVSLCVAGSCYWYIQNRLWLSFKTNDEFDDVLAFIGGVCNTYRKISKSRGYPLLGNYIIPNSLSAIQFYPTTGDMKLVISDDGIKIGEGPDALDFSVKDLKP